MADERILIVEDERLIRWSIRQRLERGNQTKAARLLNLSRDQLRYGMEKFGML